MDYCLLIWWQGCSTRTSLLCSASRAAIWSDWVYPRTRSDQTSWRNKEDYLDKPCNNHTEIGKKCNKITENNAIHTFNHYNSPFPCEYCMVYLRSDPCLGVYPVTCILARDIHWQGSGGTGCSIGHSSQWFSRLFCPPKESKYLSYYKELWQLKEIICYIHIECIPTWHFANSFIYNSM